MSLATATSRQTWKGIYHKVKKGETLWRIAKTYRVDINDITRANNIPNAASIEEHQLLLIPGAESVRSVVPVEKDGGYDWPLQGRIVSYFGHQKGGNVNKGIDIEGNDGEAVKASREGRVVLADYLPGYGETVILQHDDGFFTVYADNARTLVDFGDYVFKGEKIGQLGDNKRTALMHFEVRKGDAAENPLYYLPQEM